MTTKDLIERALCGRCPICGRELFSSMPHKTVKLEGVPVSICEAHHTPQEQ